MELVIIVGIPVLVGVWLVWRDRRRNPYPEDAAGAAAASAEADRIRSQAYGRPRTPPGDVGGIGGGSGF